MNEFKRIQPPVYNIADPLIPKDLSVNLDNKIPVYLIESGTEDIVRVEFTFKAGQVNEYLPLLASTTNLMLTEGSENYSAIELKEMVDFYGSFINLYNEKDNAGLVIYILNKHLEKVLELAGEILFRPLFPDNELSALMKKRLNWFRVNKEKVQNMAMDQFFESVFGKHHPYGRKYLVDDFENLTGVVLKDFHQKYYSVENLVIIVSGKIPENTVTVLNKVFGNFSSPNIYIEDPANKLRASTKKRVHMYRPGSTQCSVRIGSATINKTHPDYPGLKVLDAIIGGYFGSRLMKNIREDKGFTYGVGSYVTSFDLSGYKVISTDVGINNTREAIDEIYKEIELLHREPVRKDELEVVQNYMLGDLVRMFDGPFACADSFKSVWEFGLDYSYYHRLSDKIKTITPDEIIGLASTYYKLEDLYEITAGDL